MGWAIGVPSGMSCSSGKQEQFETIFLHLWRKRTRLLDRHPVEVEVSHVRVVFGWGLTETQTLYEAFHSFMRERESRRLRHQSYTPTVSIQLV